MSDDTEGGRVVFARPRRNLADEEETRLISVGVDIGSSTTHLVFSRLLMEQRDGRYIVAERDIIFESDIFLTPYGDADSIDATALGVFIAEQYAWAQLTPDKIDTGALILTGVAVRRENARAIGELFALETGKFVSVSAGDRLETAMAAHGSGAVLNSGQARVTVMNVDMGGGTTKHDDGRPHHANGNAKCAGDSKKKRGICAVLVSSHPALFKGQPHTAKVKAVLKKSSARFVLYLSNLRLLSVQIYFGS